MRLIGIMPVRNEDWVLGLSARAALLWCDELIILDHASKGGTHAIYDLGKEFPNRVTWMRDENLEWQEMRHRQRLLECARDRGATHIAIVDADEILTGNLLPSIRAHVENVSRGYILQVPGYNLRGSIGRYHANGIWGNRIFSLAFQDDRRASWQGDRFHHREPFGFPNLPYKPLAQGQGGVLHLWGSDERRLLAKQALYKMTERLRWPAKSVAEIDRYYNLAVHQSASNGTSFACRWDYAKVPAVWWEAYRGLMQYLDLAAAPWQGEEAQRLWVEYGEARFAGLDLFGVVEDSVAAR